MPLIDSLDSTRLKSLRYSGPGPAVQKDINNPPVYNSLSHEAQARIDDVQRIGYALSIGGSPYVPNNFALNAIKPPLNSQKPVQIPDGDRQSGSLFGALLGGIAAAVETFAGAALNATVQTASTLAQVGVNGTGTHFVLGFGSGRTYLRRTSGHVLAKNGARIPIPDTQDNESELKGAWSALTPKAGADHPLPDGYKLKGEKYIKNAPYTSVYNFINKKDNNTVGDKQIRDFTLADEEGLPKKIEVDGLALVKDNRLGLNKNLNRQGKVTRYTRNISQTNPEADKINESKPNTGPNEDLESQQMIKFFFEVVNPDNRGEGEAVEDFSAANQFLYFRAYLDSFTDNFNGSWTEQRYLGRADNFYTYDGFARQIQFAFKVAAESRQELVPIYDKINFLSSTTAPTYAGESGFMRGTLVNVTIGDYLTSQPGFISDLTFAWQTSYPWEINLQTGGDVQTPQLPHILDCSVSFTPIHRSLPVTGGRLIGARQDQVQEASTTNTDNG